MPAAGIEPAPRQAARDFELITGPFGKVSHYRQLSELTGFFIPRLSWFLLGFTQKKEAHERKPNEATYNQVEKSMKYGYRFQTEIDSFLAVGAVMD